MPKKVTIVPVHPDHHDQRVPPAIFWSREQVGDWIAKNGFERYRECFVANEIDGRRLIHVDASHLPKIGVTDWLHIKAITALVRELMGIEDPDWHRSVSLPPRESLAMYEEIKSQTGTEADSLSYEEFLTQTKGRVWQPPLANVGIIQNTALRSKPQLFQKSVVVLPPGQAPKKK